MIILNSRFKFGQNIKTAEVIDATDKEKVRINGTKFFQRINITEDNLKNLNYELTEDVNWRTTKPLSSGKYKVHYNNTNYFMTYLDELDLFNQVVLQQ